MAPSITVGILALQGDVREHVMAFERCGAQAIPVRTPAELEAVDALSLPGGESTTIGRLLRVFHLDDVLRRRLSAGMPTFSTCAGLILLSRSITGGRADQSPYGVLDVAVRRNGYGRQVDSFEADLHVAVLGAEPIRAVFIRAPLITEIGPEVEVIAEIDGHPVAVRQGSHLALAFHPELTGDVRLQRAFLDRVGSFSGRHPA